MPTIEVSKETAKSLADAIGLKQRVEADGDYCVVRDDKSGVWFGLLTDNDEGLATVTLEQARRAHYWEKGGCCAGLAAYGPSGALSRISPTVAEVTMGEVVEVISCSPAAAKQWLSMPEWVGS